MLRLDVGLYQITIEFQALNIVDVQVNTTVAMARHIQENKIYIRPQVHNKRDECRLYVKNFNEVKLFGIGMEFSIGLSCHDTITSPSTSSRELNVKKNSIAFNENYPHMRLYIACMHVKIRKRLHKLDKSVNCRFSRKKTTK